MHLMKFQNMFIMMFESMDNEYFRERAADIKDIKKRILAHLLGVKVNDPSTIDEQVVIIAEDLTPSDTAQLDRNFVKGFADKHWGTYISLCNHGTFFRNPSSSWYKNNLRRC